MRKITSLFFLLHISIYANSIVDDIDIEFVGILHNEMEQIMPKNKTDYKSKDSNSFTSLYSELVLNYDYSENIFLSLGTKVNKVIGEDNYSTPLYLQTKQTSDEINKAILSEVSLNYDNNFWALSLGRQDVNYDWLLGSVDGALLMMGHDKDYSLRLFWFENYRYLQYNYYTEVKDINSQRGMYGAIAKVNFKDVEFSYFDYFILDIRNIMGGHFSYMHKNYGLHLSYSSAKALSLAAYDYDEEFLNSSIEFLIRKHYFELGLSKTGKNGLLAMIQMGNFMFGEFYLSNQVDRENAKNVFLKYIYADKKWRFEFIGGTTNYDNSFFEIQNNMKAYEIDTYIKYTYSKNVSFDLGLMYMNVNERDPLQVDQSLVMFNMVVSYENY